MDFKIVNSVLGATFVPAQNTTDNVYEKDVVGNKTDSVRDSGGIATDKSLMSYVKGLVQEMHQRYVPKAYTLIGSNTLSISDKGVLTGIAQFMTYDDQVMSRPTGIRQISIIIDGVSLGTIYASSSSFSGLGGDHILQPFSLSFNHRFNSSLSVSTTTPSVGQVYTVVSYTIDN